MIRVWGKYPDQDNRVRVRGNILIKVISWVGANIFNRDGGSVLA